jgi:hypothetical protein
MKRLGSWQRGAKHYDSLQYTYLPTIKSTVTLSNNQKNARMRLQIMPRALKDAWVTWRELKSEHLKVTSVVLYCTSVAYILYNIN